MDDLGEDVVGEYLQCFHWFAFVWLSSLGLGGLDLLPDLIHVTFFSCRVRR